MVEISCFVRLLGNSFKPSTGLKWRDMTDKCHVGDRIQTTPEERHYGDLHASTFWDKFYKRNSTNFYKDRHYLHKVFPGIVHSGRVLLEIGCGVGNSIFPLVEMDSELRVFAVDFSKEAIELLQKNVLYDRMRMHAFVCDPTHEALPSIVHRDGADNLLCLFVLSAIEPDLMASVLRKGVEVLRPGGRVFFRDFARMDRAQVRFQSSSKLESNFYVRQDGTRAYFFTLEEVSRLMTMCGLRRVELRMEERQCENKREHTLWERRWVHAIFEKPQE